MKGESKKRKEKKIGKRAKKGSKKPNTTIKHHDTEQMLQGTDKYLKLSLLVFKTKTGKEISYKTKISVVNIAEPCATNMRYGTTDANEVFKMFN